MNTNIEQPYFVKKREVSAFTGMGGAAIDRAVREGKFPRPFLIGVRAKGWSRQELMDWLAERDAARANYVDPAVPSPLTEEEKAARARAA